MGKATNILNEIIDNIARKTINETIKRLTEANETEDNHNSSEAKSLRQDFKKKLKSTIINNAPIAEHMFPNMTPDAARSLFSKKVREVDNNFFTSEEITIGMNFLSRNTN